MKGAKANPFFENGAAEGVKRRGALKKVFRMSELKTECVWYIYRNCVGVHGRKRMTWREVFIGCLV